MASYRLDDGSSTSAQMSEAQDALAKYRINPSAASVVGCALATTAFAVFIISAMACAGATSSATLGNAWIAAGSITAIAGLAFAGSQLTAQDSGAKSRSSQILCATACCCALPLIFGALTRTGHIPLKVMGWLNIGPLIATLVSTSCVGSVAGSAALAKSR